MPLMYLGTSIQMTGTFLLGYIIYRLLRAAWILLSLLRETKSRPALSIINDLKAGPLRREMITRALPVFIGFFFFFSTFTSMKFLIADIKLFAWDQYFMQADRFIHFGIDPWRLLQTFLGYSLITKFIGFVYILWLPVFFLVLYWQLFRFKDDTLRMRFFYTFVLTWAINGTFLAILFSSAGPCYFDNVTGSNHYLPLMEYLRNVNDQTKIWSVYTQDLLWKNYSDKGIILGGGISAFPSVHVATTFLFVLMARHINTVAYYLFLIFFLLIFIGSIHLGWHYAVDGYAAMATTWALWNLTGYFLKNHYLQLLPDSHAQACLRH